MSRPLQRIKVGVLTKVRRGRPVAWAPDWMNIGNLLYLGLWAWRADERRVLALPAKEASLRWFPTLRQQQFISAGQVRLTDQRLQPWREVPDATRWQGIDEYVRETLLPASPLTARPRDITDDSLVVNVRRGDYFTPAHQHEFGMDTIAYTRTALERMTDLAGLPGRIIIVSDDPEWCREHLLGVATDFAVTTVRDGTPAEDLQALVHAPRLLLPNSTFSYWGGRIGDALHSGRQVAAPWLFSRQLNGGKALLPEHWEVIETIPGGWDQVGA